MRVLPPINGLLAFEAVVRLNGLAAAGDELGISQSAVSHRLRQLDDYFEEPLLEKQGRKLVMTALGRSYYHEVERILNELSLHTAQLKGVQRGQLQLTSYSSYALKRLIPALAKFRARHPEVDLRLQMVSHEPTLSSSNGDLFICFDRGNANYSSHLLHQERFKAVCSPQLFQELSQGDWRANLTNFPLLSCDLELTRKDTGADWQLWAARVGIALPQTQVYQALSHQVMALEAAESGQGIALASDFMVEKDIQEGRLVALPVDGVETGYDFRLCYRHSRAREPNMKAVINWLLELAEQ